MCGPGAKVTAHGWGEATAQQPGGTAKPSARRLVPHPHEGQSYSLKKGVPFPPKSIYSSYKSFHPIVSQGSRASPVKTGVCPAVSPLCIPTFPSIPFPLHPGWQDTLLYPEGGKKKNGGKKRRNGDRSGVLQSATTLDFPHLC